MRPMPGSPASPLNVALGRALALCAHPYAAWRTQTRTERIFLVLAYAGAGYALMLAALLTR